MIRYDHLRRSSFTTALTFLLLLGLALPALADEPNRPRTLFGPNVTIECEDGEDDCANSFFFMQGRGGYLGVRLTELTPALRRHLDLPSDSGVLIEKVLEDTPASRAGLLEGDIVTAIDGETVERGSDIGRLIRGLDGGTQVSITYQRAGRMDTTTTEIEARERSTFDVGAFMNDFFEKNDFQHLTERSWEFSQDTIQDALKSVEQYFDSEDWEDAMQRIKDIDYDQIEIRMEELQERLQELEQRLEKRIGDGRNR